jgi:hypothetical protein
MSILKSSALWLLLAACSVLGPLAAAQEDKDPQSAFEPRSGPGAGQKFLAQFVGDWDVVKTFYSRAGQPATTKGFCRQTMIHNGNFLRSEFTFQQGDAQTTGLGLIGFEPASATFTSVWTDSRATRMSLRQSNEKFGGEEIVLDSRSLGGTTESRSSRTVTKLEENGGKIIHRQFSRADDGSERLVMELLMTRKSDPPADRK